MRLKVRKVITQMTMIAPENDRGKDSSSNSNSSKRPRVDLTEQETAFLTLSEGDVLDMDRLGLSEGDISLIAEACTVMQMVNKFILIAESLLVT